MDSGASKPSTVWRQVATAKAPNHPLPVAIRCQAVDSGANKASTVWRQVATATGGYSDRWLQRQNWQLSSGYR